MIEKILGFIGDISNKYKKVKTAITLLYTLVIGTFIISILNFSILILVLIIVLAKP